MERNRAAVIFLAYFSPASRLNTLPREDAGLRFILEASYLAQLRVMTIVLLPPEKGGSLNLHNSIAPCLMGVGGSSE